MRSVVIITLGNILLTGAYAFLTVPNNMIDGGVTSTSLIIAHLLDVDITYITTTIAILLLLFSLAFLGKQFFFKTAYSCLCYIIFFDLFHLTNIVLNMPPKKRELTKNEMKKAEKFVEDKTFGLKNKNKSASILFVTLFCR